MILVLVAIDQELTVIKFPDEYNVVEMGVGKVNAADSTVRSKLFARMLDKRKLH